MRPTVYVISGPAGVGKSTTSGKLVQMRERSAYISGDDISHIPVNGRGKPWLCEKTNRLTWINISSLARNLLNYHYDVIIDYVSFPLEVRRLYEELEDLDIEFVYVVLLVDSETLQTRDQSRPKEIQMGERSLILLEEFREALSDDKYVLRTEEYSEEQLEEVVNEIMNNEKFRFGN